MRLMKHIFWENRTSINIFANVQISIVALTIVQNKETKTPLLHFFQRNYYLYLFVSCYIIFLPLLVVVIANVKR